MISYHVLIIKISHVISSKKRMDHMTSNARLSIDLEWPYLTSVLNTCLACSCEQRENFRPSTIFFESFCFALLSCRTVKSTKYRRCLLQCYLYSCYYSVVTLVLLGQFGAVLPVTSVQTVTQGMKSPDISDYGNTIFLISETRDLSPRDLFRSHVLYFYSMSAICRHAIYRHNRHVIGSTFENIFLFNYFYLII